MMAGASLRVAEERASTASETEREDGDDSETRIPERIRGAMASEVEAATPELQASLEGDPPPT